MNHRPRDVLIFEFLKFLYTNDFKKNVGYYIIRKTGINHKIFKDLIQVLLLNNLINIIETKRGVRYDITQRGIRAMKSLEVIQYYKYNFSQIYGVPLK